MTYIGTVVIAEGYLIRFNGKEKRDFKSFLAHLSQRLIGELIGYPWSGVRPSASVVHPS